MRLDPHHHGGDPFAGSGRPDRSGSRLNLLLSDPAAGDETWAHRLPRLLEPLGIQAHMAASGREASDLMRATTIHIAVVDLGLPLETQSLGSPPNAAAREAGWRLLEVLSRLAHRPPTVAIKTARTRRDEAREMSAALRLGAFAVLDRPRTTRDVETLLEVLRRCIARHYQGQWPA